MRSPDYKVKLASGIWERDNYVAGDARHRGEDLNGVGCTNRIASRGAVLGFDRPRTR